MKYRIIILALALFTFAGCGQEKKPDPNKPDKRPAIEEELLTNETTTEDPIKIRIFQYKEEISGSLEEACALYMKENPSIIIEVETLGEGYNETLKEKMATGQTVDIFNIQGLRDMELYKDKLEDLSDEPWVENAVEGVLDPVTDEKEIYGLPYGLEGYGLIYNKEIFEAAGINTLDLTNYEAIRNAFEQLQLKITAGELSEQFPDLVAVTQLPGAETWVTGGLTGNVVLSNEFKNVAEAFEATTVRLQYKDQFQKLIDLQADYSEYRNAKYLLNTITTQDEIRDLALEKVAVIQQGNWITPEISKLNNETVGKLAILPLPLFNINENSISVGVPMYWCVNKEVPDINKKAAKDFLNWLYKSEEGKLIITNNFGFIPPFTNYMDYSVKDVLGNAVVKYIKAGQVTNWVFSGLPEGWTENSIGANIQNYLANTMSWKEVMDKAIKDFEAERQ